MTRIPSISTTLLVVALTHASAHGRRVFEFDFAGPDRVEDVAGAEVSFDVDTLLIARGVASSEEGVEAWSMAVRVDGGEVTSVAFDDAFDADAVSFRYAEHVDGAVVLVVLLDDGEQGDSPATLPLGESPYAVATIALAASIPSDEPCAVCTLQYVDGLQGAGRPVTNVVTASATSFAPVLGRKTVRLVSPTPEPLPPTELTEAEDVIFEETLLPCRDRAVLSFHVAEPPPEDSRSAVVLTLGGDVAPDSFALRVRWGEPPTATKFDLDGTMTLVIPEPRSDVGYAEIRSVGVVEESTLVRLTARLVRLEVESVEPARGAEETTVSLTVRGAGFRAGHTEFALESDDESVPARSLAVLAPDRTELSFDLRGTDRGRYDLVASDTETGVSSRLDSAFEVVAPSVLFGLELALEGQARYRIRDDDGQLQQNRLTLRYRNVADRELPAPLLLVRGPEGVRLRLEPEAELREREIAVLATDPGGHAGRLAPDAGRDLAIVFTSDLIGDSSTFEVHLLTPRPGEFVPWQDLEPLTGTSQTSWSRIVERFSARFGSRWDDYALGLGEIATVLARRGVDTTSVLSLVRFAARGALLRPTAAALGRVRDRSGKPLAGTSVQAVQSGRVLSSDRTDENGTFAVDWLRHGEDYELRVEGFGGHRAMTIPANGDLHDQLLTVDQTSEGLESVCAVCDTSDLPTEPLLPPRASFTRLLQWRTALVGAVDPNEKDGPKGEGELGCIDLPAARGFRRGGCVGPDSDLFYTIHFENVGNAAARRVAITDRLDPRIEIASIRLRDVTLGDGSPPLSLDTRCGTRFTGYECDPFTLVLDQHLIEDLVDDRATRVHVGIDRDRHELEWDITRVDGEGDLTDLLPPRGRGSVSFVASVAPGAAEEGDDIENDATITFDNVATHALDTNGVANRFSEFLIPGVPRNPVPAAGDTVETTVALLWEDVTGGFFYDVYLAVDGAPDELVAEDLPSPSYSATSLEFETTYAWRVVARNLRGQETTGPLWTFTTVPPPECPAPPSGLEVAGGETCLPPPTLRWDASPGAAVYSVIFTAAEDPAAAQTIAAGLSATSLKVPSWIVPGTYTWRVIAASTRCTDGSAESTSEASTVSVCGFRRGDANADGGRDIADALFALNHLFAGGAPPPCFASSDANDDGAVNIADPLYVLNHLFAGGLAPPAPTTCGVDPTPDELGCVRYEHCVR